MSAGSSPIRILAVDDHALFRDGTAKSASAVHGSYTNKLHIQLLLRFNWSRTAVAATLGSCLISVLLLPTAVHALDPNKRLTQYIHTSWRVQDGSAPWGMYAITQTSDGFLWFFSSAAKSTDSMVSSFVAGTYLTRLK